MGEKKRKDDDTCRVKVHIRLKQCPPKESATYNIFADGTQLHIPNHEGRLELDRWYRFDHIYSAIASNKEVYKLSTYDLVESALKGLNTAIFAYGQTGSGKTHTLMSKDGVTAHMVSHLFNRIWKRIGQDYKVSCSYFQIYNERIYDLLNPQNNLECIVREDASNGVYVENITHVLCETPMDVYELINIGRRSLVLAESKMCRLSCRSHSVCQLSIEKRRNNPRTKKRSMQESYSVPDILVDKPDEENNSNIDFTTVPFNKANLRKRHSIAVTKINENMKSPRPPRSPSIIPSKLPPTSPGRPRARSNSMKGSERRNNVRKDSPSSDMKNTPEYRTSLSQPSSNKRVKNKSTDDKPGEKRITMADSIGIANVRRLHDLYQSSIVESESGDERIQFDPQNSFTYSEDSNDDYDTSEYLEVENGHDDDNSVFNDETGSNGINGEMMVFKSKISIIDLAGSERLNEPNVDSERLKEAQSINLSLLELGNVISALASGKKKHVPYRNSVLTRLLQDSLGGNCKTKFLLCISSKTVDTNETKCTLEFGQKLTKVFTKPILNMDIDYKRKYDQLVTDMNDKEKVYELVKNEFSTRLSIFEKEIEEKNETTCDHDLLLNSMQIKLNKVDKEHQESNRKIELLQQSLVDKESMLKMKDDELSNLKMEFDIVLQKLETTTLSSEIVTCDATTATSLTDLSDNDTIDGPINFDIVTNDISDTTVLALNMECLQDDIDDLLDSISNTTNDNTPKEQEINIVENMHWDLVDTNIVNDSPIQTSSPLSGSSTTNDTDIAFINTSDPQYFGELTDVSDREISLVETMDATTNTEDDYLIESFSTKTIETCDVATNTSGNNHFSDDPVIETSNADTTGIPVSNPIVVTFIQSPITTSTANISVETSDKTTNTPRSSLINTLSNENLLTSLNTKASTNGSLNFTGIDEGYLNGNSTKSYTHLFTQYADIDLVRSAILVELLTLQRLGDRCKIACNEMLESPADSIATLNEYTEPINDGVSVIILEIFSILQNIMSESQRSSNSSKLSCVQVHDTDKKPAISKPTLKTAPVALKYAPVEDQLVFLQDYLRNRKQSIEKELLDIAKEITNGNDLHLYIDSISELKIIEILIQKLSDGNSLSTNNIELFHKLLNIVLCDHTITACLIALTQRRSHGIDPELTSNSTVGSGIYTKGNGQNLSYQLAIYPSPNHQTIYLPDTFHKSDIDDNVKNGNANDGKKGKSFLNRFLCVPSKSAKLKKSKETKKDMHSVV